MKTLFILLCTIISIQASALPFPVDTLPAPPDTVQFELTHYQHVMVYAYLPSKESVDSKRYERFLTDSIPTFKDSTGKVHLLTPNARLKYWPKVPFLEYCFSSIGAQPERLVASDNRKIQQELINQLAVRRPDVLQRIGLIVAGNAMNHEQVVSENGIEVLHKLKL